MDTADWLARGIAGASLGVSFLAVALSWRWRKSDTLLRLHESLRAAKSAALEHLDVGAGEHPTERDVTDLLEDARQRAASAPWEDVREAAERLFEECKVVLEPRVRERLHERKEPVRRAIQEAFESASATIAERTRKGAGRGFAAARRPGG